MQRRTLQHGWLGGIPILFVLYFLQVSLFFHFNNHSASFLFARSNVDFVYLELGPSIWARYWELTAVALGLEYCGPKFKLG